MFETEERHIYKILPALKDYIWGGAKLKALKKCNTLDKIAESWEISTHPDGECHLESEEGQTLLKELTGDIPFIVKYIDAAGNLSVQVHPDDKYARIHENSCGKNEMWLTLDAEKDASIYLGFNRCVSREEVKKSAENGELLNLLNRIPVKRGEAYFIPAGTVHAICKGCFICEIQQPSALTYRIFDYNRKGADGLPRPLHIEKALDVLNFDKYSPSVADEEDARKIFRKIVKNYDLRFYRGEGEFSLESPPAFALFYEGIGQIECGKEKICAFAGETYFCDFGNIKISGNCKAIIIAAV